MHISVTIIQTTDNFPELQAIIYLLAPYLVAGERNILSVRQSI